MKQQQQQKEEKKKKKKNQMEYCMKCERKVFTSSIKHKRKECFFVQTNGFLCNECGVIFASLDDLLTHRVLYHSYQHMCHAFGANLLLCSQRKRQMTQMKPFECLSCHRRFLTKQALSAHSYHKHK